MGSRFYEHPQFKRLYGNKIVTPRVALAWPALVTPRPPPPPQDGQKPGQPRYEVTAVIDKNDTGADVFLDELNTMVEEMVTQYNASAKKDRRPQIIIDEPLIDGDGGKYNLEKYPYYENSWLLIARNANDVVFKNAKGEKFFDATVFKGGDIGRCEITPHLGSTGISFKLEAVQLIKRGTVTMGGFTADGGALLQEEEDGEDLVEAGAPAKVTPPRHIARAVAEEEEEMEDTDDSEEDIEDDVVNKHNESPVPMASRKFTPEPENPEAVKGRDTTPQQVKLTGKQLAESLKANAVAAQRAQAQAPVPPKQAAVVKAQPPAAKPVSKGKAAAVDML